MFTALSLLGGLMFLALGSAALIRGTAGFAQLAGVSPFLISLVVVGFGTSTPQLFTAMQATVSGVPVLALSTAIGASIFNIFATLGAVALGGGAVQLNWRLWLRGSLALSLMALLMASAVAFFTLHGHPLPRWLGLAALALLAVYVFGANAYDSKHPIPIPLLKETRKLHPLAFAGLFAAGLFGLVLGANLLVDVATALATTRGLNPTLLGLTILGVGTALPQLVGSFIAFRDKHHAMLLNNLIANTIFNLLGVGGLLIALQPVHLPQGTLLYSFVVLAVATVAFAIFTHTAMRRFKRAEAILFLLAYITYLAYVLHLL